MLGSPPRVRGKLFEAWRRAQHDRITPAHAGKTEPETVLCRTCMDHPRACGENHPKALHLTEDVGSPPRMRGKRNKIVKIEAYAGITPA